ncbi:hypothetical protein JL722_7054 [Aureococcus anophagefferens]|nr:hypothetical protein JL722_7054 [Aureococcus anophagefferens]
MMFDFAFGGRRGGGASTGAPAHWGAMDDDYDDDDGESGESGESDDECDEGDDRRASGARRAARVPSGEPGALSVGELKALLRDRDVANAADAGDARAARALSAAERVGLEPGGQYRALFDHAARLVKAAGDRARGR